MNLAQTEKNAVACVILSEEQMRTQYNNDEQLISKYVVNNEIALPYNIQNVIKSKKPYYVQYKGTAGLGYYKFLPVSEEEALSIYKQYAKSLTKNHKKINNGSLIMLKTKSYDGSQEEIKVFKIISTIYTIKSQVVNVYILKQISGKQIKIFTLNKCDCEKLHIKFEEGLQIWPINLNWKVVSRDKTN